MITEGASESEKPTARTLLKFAAKFVHTLSFACWVVKLSSLLEIQGLIKECYCIISLNTPSALHPR